jgi:tetratricopeptide (TPR) repeat protein
MQAAILKQTGDYEGARKAFRAVVDAQGPPPFADNPVLNFETGELYALCGQPKLAAPYYEKAVEMGPSYTNALNNYAWFLATGTEAEVRDGRKAVQLAQKACELSQWKVPVIIGTLAAAYAQAGRFEDAVRTAERARDLASEQGVPEVAKRNEELLGLYREKKAYQE